MKTCRNQNGEIVWYKYIDKDGKFFKKPQPVLIERMDTDHIKKICDRFFDRLSPEYRLAFLDELKKRGEAWGPQ